MNFIGFTWFSLTDQIDWDSALAQDRASIQWAFTIYSGVRGLWRRQFCGNCFCSLAVNRSSPGVRARFSQGAGPPPPPAKVRPKPQHVVGRRQPGAPRKRRLPSLAPERKHRCGRHRPEWSGKHFCTWERRRFVRPGDTVLIKPNQTMWRLSSDGCTTDPRVAAALARSAREAGAGVVQVGKCSSCGQITRDVMKVTGTEDAARELQGRQTDLF